MSKGLNTCLFIALILLCCSGMIYSILGKPQNCGWINMKCCSGNKCLNSVLLSCKEDKCVYDPTLKSTSPPAPRCGGNNLPCCTTGPAGKACARGLSCNNGECKLPTL